jgi:hypothetical protein
MARTGSSKERVAALTFTADMYRKLFPGEYMKTCLARGVRPDSRAAGAARGVQLQLGVIRSAASSSLVKTGSTSVIAAVKLAVGTPAVATPDQGEVGTLLLLVVARQVSSVRLTASPRHHASYPGAPDAAVLDAVRAGPSVGGGAEHRQSAHAHHCRVRRGRGL